MQSGSGRFSCTQTVRDPLTLVNKSGYKHTEGRRNFVSLERVREMVKRILDAAPLSVDGLADAAGVSRHTLYAWAAGRRNPSPENLQKLADALDARGEDLHGLADELRKEAAGELEG